LELSFKQRKIMFDFIGFVIGIAFLIFWAIAWMKIFWKAGYSGWLGLLVFVPIVNIFLILYLGFSEWPVLRGKTIIQTKEKEEVEKEFKKQSNFPSTFK
jgi:hypothetical protein